jgi:2-amino-4-hydroxy-6-hydroxymethyldihydropteridine diphosphokinase
MNVNKITYLSVGTNQGKLLENLQLVINLISYDIGDVLKISSVYKSGSWGFKGNDFLNICVKVSTKLTIEELWQKIIEIEHALGRKKRQTAGYENRIIDIDVLLFNNQVIQTKGLIVPHPKMLERNFVLIPLVEISSLEIHPISKEKMEQSLANCNDSTTVTKTDLKLIPPLSLSQKYNYIAVEGNIGAGKTTLAHLIGKQFNARLVLERFSDNPFLPKFYKNKDRYAFPLEMSFLADRYQQLTNDIEQFDLFKNLIVSDYYIFKSLIFSQITLAQDEYHLYRRVFDVMYKDIIKPDLYIYLYQNTERLLSNIKKRGRNFEKNIQAEYLDKIHKGYFNFIKTEQNLNTLIIDVSDLDFVKNKQDYDSILKKIINHKKIS